MTSVVPHLHKLSSFVEFFQVQTHYFLQLLVNDDAFAMVVYICKWRASLETGVNICYTCAEGSVALP